MRASRCLLLTLCASGALALAAAPAAPKPAPPSRTTLKIFAIEYALLAKLAGPGKEVPKAIADQAAFLKRFGGAGYGIRATVPTAADAAASQRKQREAAYVALTEPHIQAGLATVKDFEKRERIQIKAGKTAAGSQDRAYPLLAKAAGIQELIDIAQGIIDSSSGAGVSPEDGAILRARRELARKRIALLRELAQAVKQHIDAVKAYDGFAGDIRAAAKKDELAERAEALRAQAAGLAAQNSGVAKAEAVGTQQMRIELDPAARDAAKAALAERLGDDTKRKDPDFIEGSIDFLPLAWPFSAPSAPHGDFHITEYVCGEELVLTLYDAAGLFHRIVVLEYGGARFIALAHSITVISARAK